MPPTMDEALELWESSELAAAAFGPEVVSHYATMARVELDAYRGAVTDWELRRYFDDYDSHRAHHVRGAATMLVWQREFALLHATYLAATDGRAASPSCCRPSTGSTVLGDAARGGPRRCSAARRPRADRRRDVDPQRYGEAPGERRPRRARCAMSGRSPWSGPRWT